MGVPPHRYCPTLARISQGVAFSRTGQMPVPQRKVPFSRTGKMPVPQALNLLVGCPARPPMPAVPPARRCQRKRLIWPCTCFISGPPTSIGNIFPLVLFNQLLRVQESRQHFPVIQNHIRWIHMRRFPRCKLFKVFGC